MAPEIVTTWTLVTGDGVADGRAELLEVSVVPGSGTTAVDGSLDEADVDVLDGLR